MSAVERMLAMLAAPGTETCDAAASDVKGLACRRPPHPHEVDDEQPHIGLIDGSPVQWINVPAGQAESDAGAVSDGGA